MAFENVDLVHECSFFRTLTHGNRKFKIRQRIREIMRAQKSENRKKYNIHQKKIDGITVARAYRLPWVLKFEINRPLLSDLAEWPGCVAFSAG